jgi:hypothetical protein
MRHVLFLQVSAIASAAAPIPLSDAQRARIFDGVGGISGGGATSRLIEDYPAPKVSAIYDALFSPQIAAAFQNVKVEIPADADTTCGSEVAHRHDAADGGSCTRGYEGIFLAEANARRPGLSSHALQWAAPSFVGEPDVDAGKSLFTRTNIESYVVPWLRCMRDEYNVTITWMGGAQNEQGFNTTYIKLMRGLLNASDFSATGIAAADQCCGGEWNIIPDIVADADLRAAVGAISTHCAGSFSRADTPISAIDLGIPLFQGEEHIGLPDPDPIPIWQWAAAGATGVEVSQNWILNNMSATIYWPAAYAWLSGLSYQGKGFVIATSPWGDAPCYIPTALWVLAHTTHFTTPRVSWLLNGTGSGHITDAQAPVGNGGWNYSYVGYDSGGDVTLVVESFLAGGQWHASPAGGPGDAPPPPVNATFVLEGAFAKFAGGTLHVWHTNESVTFERLPDAPVGVDGTFTVSISPGEIFTYTTVESAHPGAAAWLAKSEADGGCVAAPSLQPTDKWPAEAPFPLPYRDDFEGYSNDTLPLFTSDMFGAFTVFELPPTAVGPSVFYTRADPADARTVACGDAAARALRPRRCTRERVGGNNTRVLRQWTRSPPLGWGRGANNMATILGNGTLGNISLSVRALIETPDAGYEPAAPPYVEVGLNGGSGSARESGPSAFYRADADADTLWFNETAWGCKIAANPAVCAEAHPLTFGLDTWHAITFAELPTAVPDTRIMTATLDGAVLFNVTVSPVKNGGSGGYVMLRTGAHRAMFDDLEVTTNALSN